MRIQAYDKWRQMTNRAEVAAHEYEKGISADWLALNLFWTTGHQKYALLSVRSSQSTDITRPLVQARW